MKGSLKNVESSFICRRCKGELCETRQVNGLHADVHEYEIVDKFCYLGDMLRQVQEQLMQYLLQDSYKRDIGENTGNCGGHL